MAIVYSYEQATQPALGDLLLGTDISASGKPTKSFSIQSIVDLVETGVPGGGTVTSIDTTATTFISLIGGRITTTGSLSASLSATGVPSATTYLRGDNTWSTIPSSNNTTYSIDTAQSGTSVNLRLNASDGSNTIVSFVPGCNTILTSGANGSITIGSSCDSSGTVTSVNAGIGLKVQSGNISIDPVIAMDYVGSNNYIVRSQAQTTPAPIDYIPFNNVSTGNVKTTTLSEIPITALEAVKTYVDAGDVGDIRNDTDTFVTTASVNNVVSLTSAEYTALASKDANTLYLVVGAATSYTNTLNVDTSNITGTEYTINPSFDVTGSTRQGITGALYSFDTRITANSGFEFNPPIQINNAAGTFGSADATVNTTTNVTTVQAIAVPQCRATLSLAIAPCLGALNTQYTLSGDTNGSFRENDCPLTVPSAGVLPFSTTVNVLAGYESDPSNPVTVTNWTGTISGDQTVETVITGCIRAVSVPVDDVTITPNLINAYDLNGNQSQVNLSVTPGQLTGQPGQTYTFADNSTVNAGFEIINPSVTGLTGTYPNNSGTVNITYTGTVSSVDNTIIVNDTPVNNIAGPTAGYNITYSPTNLQITGTTPSLVYEFAHYVELNTGYQWAGGVVPTVTNAQGTLTVAGTYPVQSTIGNIGQSTVELSPTNPVATLNVTYNITQDGVLNPPNPVWSPAGNLYGIQESGASPFFYNFDTYADGTPTITIPATYQFDVAPSTNPSPITPAQGITTNTTVPVTVSATISEIPVSYYTLLKCSTQAGGFTSSQTTAQVSLNTNDQIYDLANPLETYIVTGNSASQGTSISVSSVQGTLCPPTLYYYIIENCANSAQLQYGYSQQPNLGAGDTFNYQSNCYKYYDVDPTEVGTINLDVLATCQCGPEEGTINFTVTNNVTGGENTTLARETTSVVGTVGDPYTFANAITANAGYQLSNIQWNPSATVVTSFVSGTRNISQTVTGNATLIPIEYYALQKCSTGGSGFTTNLNTTQLTLSTGDIVVDTAPNPDEYYTVLAGRPTVQGSTFVSLTGLNDCPAPLYYWNAVQCSGSGTVKISTTNALIGPGDSYTFNSVCYKIVDTDPTQTPAYNIDTFSGCCTGTVNVNFTNSVSGKANTTTIIADGGTASATGPVGTSYSIANSISANNGYEFTVPASWSTGGTGTVTGTFVSGITNINQNVTGTVEAVAPPSCNVNVGYTFSIFTICDAPETTPITMYHLGACDICGATSIDASFVSGMSINDVVQVKYNGVYMPFQKQSAGSIAVSSGSCLVCPPPPEEYTVTLAFTNNVTNDEFTTNSLTPGATITGNPGDSYQFVHTITTDPGYEFTSGPFWTDSVSNNGTGTINGTIPNSNTTITQSVSGVVEQEVVECNCITVDVLNTQLTNDGLDLYYIFNSCSAGETSVNLAQYPGIEQNGSTYFALCETGAGGNLYKYGPNGSPFVGLPGMNTNPNQDGCVDNFECTAVVP